MYDSKSKILDLVDFIKNHNFITISEEDDIEENNRKNCTECGTIVEKGKQCANCGLTCYSTTMKTKHVSEGKRLKK